MQVPVKNIIFQKMFRRPAAQEGEDYLLCGEMPWVRAQSGSEHIGKFYGALPRFRACLAKARDLRNAVSAYAA